MHERRKQIEDFSRFVIVGAGPAGVSAALELAKQGVKCTLIDENPQPGGVVYRGPLREYGPDEIPDDALRNKIQSIREELRKYSDYIHIIMKTQVLGEMERGRKLALYNHENRLFSYEYKYLLLCTGCYERSVPFPGWTLPGVMTVGGVQLMVKSGLVRPGKRILLSGTGPLLITAAVQFQRAGMEVVGVHEAGRRLSFLKKPLPLLQNLKQMREGFGYLKLLKKAGIPVFFGSGIMEARGAKELEEVRVATYDSDWRPLEARADWIRVDTLGVSFGFIPRAQLSQLLEVEQVYSRYYGYQPETDEWRRTSKKNIFAAGDGAGVYGAGAAAAQGELAALGVLMDEGLLSPEQASRRAGPLRGLNKRFVKFRESFDVFSRPGPGLLELAQADTVVCRCENKTRANVEKVLEQGVGDMTTLKMAVRIGMGDCQGKLCADFCHGLLENKSGREGVGLLQPRFPLAPLPFDAVLNGRNS